MTTITEMIEKYKKERRDTKLSLDGFLKKRERDCGIMTSICAHQIVVIDDVLGDLELLEQQYKHFVDETWYDEKYVQQLKDEIEKLKSNNESKASKEA